jgi:hypothetical protein
VPGHEVAARLAIAVALGAVCLQGAARAGQDAEFRQRIPFLEGSDVFVNLPSNGLLFEANLSPNLVVLQNVSKLNTLDPRTDTSRHRAYAFSFDPMVRLRMLNQYSAPVSPPSYMPKLTYQEFRLRANGSPLRPRVDMWALQATVGHHSNGQDGCVFTDQTRNGDSCAPRVLDRTPDPASVDTHSGSFSTNYLMLGVRFRRTALDDENRGRWDWTAGVDVEWNPIRFFGDGGLDAEIAPLYGATRVSLVAGAATKLTRLRWLGGPCASRLEVVATVKYIADASSTVPPVATTIRGACIFRDSGGWGVLLRFYRGQDYYNINFLQDIARFNIGLTYEQEGFLRFRPGPRR